MKQRNTGRVSHFNYVRGFGFIQPADKSTQDAFVHRTKCPPGTQLYKNSIVDYSYVQAARGMEVVEIHSVDNTNAEKLASEIALDAAGPESNWIEARVKFFHDYGFAEGEVLRRDAFISQSVLCWSGWNRPPMTGDPVRVKVRTGENGRLIVSRIEPLEG